jgi:hypothetical protein
MIRNVLMCLVHSLRVAPLVSAGSGGGAAEAHGVRREDLGARKGLAQVDPLGGRVRGSALTRSEVDRRDARADEQAQV